MVLKTTGGQLAAKAITCFVVKPSARGWLIVTEAENLELGVFPTKDAAKQAAKGFAHANQPSRVKVFTQERRD